MRQILVGVFLALLAIEILDGGLYYTACRMAGLPNGFCITQTVTR